MLLIKLIYILNYKTPRLININNFICFSHLVIYWKNTMFFFHVLNSNENKMLYRVKIGKISFYKKTKIITLKVSQNTEYRHVLQFNSI